MKDFYIFSDNKYKRYLLHDIKRQYMQDVHIEHVERGIIVNEHFSGFGIFNQNFEFIKSSEQVRRNNGQFVPRFNHENIPFVDKNVVFIGLVYPEFGHFLLEQMNRAWALLDEKYRKMHVVLINNQDVKSVPEYMYVFLELMGISRDRIIILNETTQFRNVYIPTQGYNLPVYTCEEFGKTFDFMVENAGKPTEIYEKIFVSRDALKLRRTYGEKYVSKIFEKNGFKIIYPEKLSLIEQIQLISNCKVLAGCAGTALHLAVFMKPGGTVIQIKRNKKNKDSASTQHLVNKVKKLTGVFISGSIEKKPTSHFVSVPQIIGLNKYVRQFFDQFGFVYDKNLPVMDKQIWQEYVQHLADYKQENGTLFMLSVKQNFVRISACFIPGRENRGIYRRWMKSKLRID